MRLFIVDSNIQFRDVKFRHHFSPLCVGFLNLDSSSYPDPTLQTGIFIFPAFVRREAYLREGKSKEAVIEFQKFVEHHGATVNCELGALARLQLGRAYELTGEMEKARASYQDFLTLWEDADPDIPVLKQARAEYAKLR